MSSTSCTPTRVAHASATLAGPDLLTGTNIILGVNSFVANSVCTSNTYSYRVDTSKAQQWIRSTVAARGGSI